MNTIATILLAAPGIVALIRLVLAISHPSVIVQVMEHVGRAL